MALKTTLSICLHLFTVFVNTVECYEVPPALVEPLSPHGLRVSIPDDDGITLFAFHGNVNKDFEDGLEAGEMATDIVRKRNGRWTYVNRNIKLKKGDILYYWLYVIKDKLGYRRLFQSHVVTDFYDGTEGNKSPPITPSPPHVTDTTPPHLPPKDPCKKSLTQVNGVSNVCRGALVFNSEFRNGINKDWSHVVEFAEDESEFTVFDNDRSVLFSQAESIVLKPIFLDHKYHDGFATDQTLDLSDRCTSTSTKYCIQTAGGPVILPPILSARITTAQRFSFRYGTVEIKAKLPHGDWIVPEIWLLPKSKQFGIKNSGKMIITKSFGNDDLKINGDDYGNHFLHSGLEVGNKTTNYRLQKQSGPLSDEYHVFKMVWEPDQIKFYIDDREFGNWNSQIDQPFLVPQTNKIAPFNQEFYLVLGVHVGGIVDFPDGCLNRGKPKPWRNGQVARRLSFYKDSENWLETWDDRSALRVEHVKVWAL